MVIPYSNLEILETFQQTDGNIVKTAELLQISPQTIYTRLGLHEDLEDKLYTIRKSKYIQRCDAAESTIDKLLSNVDNHPSVALSAAKYYLETHARKRGYGVVETPQQKAPEHNNLIADHQELSWQSKYQKLKKKYEESEDNAHS